MSLSSLLHEAASRHPVAHILCLDEAGAVAERFTNRELLEQAQHVAARAAGLPPTPVLLAVADLADFLRLFWGLVLAGRTPAVIAPPRDASEAEQQRLLGAARRLGAPLVLDRGFPEDPRLLSAESLLTGPVGPIPSPEDPEIGLIQLSSGSTGSPRGVMLSQRALLANLAQMRARLPVSAQDRVLTWMPHHHDMGLIGLHLLPLSLGMEQLRLPPQLAVRDPLLWMRLVAEHEASVTASTAFVLRRLNRALRGAPPLRPPLRVLASGAEPLPPAVLAETSRLLALPESVHFPMYGMAEACVAISQPREGGLRVRRIGGLEGLALGQPMQGLELRITPVEGYPPELGELRVRGPNLFSGYAGEPEASAEALDEDGFLRTGDLGALVEGEVLVLGRLKDQLIVNGRNLAAHEVEGLAEALPGVRAAIALADTRGGEERLVLALRLRPDASPAPLLAEVRRALYGALGVWPLTLVMDPLPTTPSGKKQRGPLRARLNAGELDDLASEASVQAVCRAWAQALGLPEVSPEARWSELGGGSIQAAELLGRLERELGLKPDFGVLRRASTPRALAALLERGEPEAEPQASPNTEALVISAAAFRLPGAEGWSGLKALLAQGRPVWGPPPPERAEDFDTPVVGAFLPEVYRFDPQPFGLGEEEAAAMDPQQRLLLTLAAELAPAIGGARELGVFVAADHFAQAQALRHPDEALHPSALAGNLLNGLAARISQSLDLHGPAMAIDSACSGALVALKLGAQAIHTGQCKAALVGAVHLNLGPTVFEGLRSAGVLSPSGSCRPFAPDRDGTVPGEGGALFLLETEAAARAAGREPLAVLRGLAVQNDGASLSAMAPNPAGQERVLREALAQAAVNPAQIQTIEAHAAGTPLGDEVEAGLIQRLYPHGPKVGAVKGQLGHLMAAAGAAGLLRLLCDLEPGQLGAVSAFGFGGTSAHLILEAGRIPQGPDPARGGQILRLGQLSAEGWLHALEPDPGGGLRVVPEPARPSPLHEGVACLITGAFGALGGLLARHLARRYGARLLLQGRREPPGTLKSLRRLGAQAQAFAGDLNSPGFAEQLAQEAAAMGVRWVFHLAGSLGAQAHHDKVDSLLALERAWSAPEPTWVLFSSISAALPGLDQGIEAYAEANRALDRWARTKRAAGHSALSLAWPAWERLGMGAAHSAALARRGVPTLSPARGLAALEAALASPRAQLLVMERPPEAQRALPEDLEGQLRALLGAAAGLEPDSIDPDRSFPALGVDSLEAIEIVRKLERLVGRALPTTLLYEHDTLSRLLAALRGGASRQQAPTPAPVPDAPLALTPTQRAFTLHSRYFPQLPGNVLLAVDLSRGSEPALDQALLGRALERLSAQRFMLRARVTGGSSPCLVEGPPAELRWVPTLDQAQLHTLHNEPFSLEQGPLLRVISDGRRLVVNGHHVVIDAWSARILVEELLRAHEALREGQPVSPSPAPDWPQIAPLLLAQDPGEQALSAWRARYPDGVPALRLPLDASEQQPVAGPFDFLSGELPPVPTAALQARARDWAVSLPALALTAWVQVLWQASGQHDLVVRVAVGRRELRLPGLERSIGSFADSLPARITLRPGEPLPALALRVHAELAAISAHAAASSTALAALGVRDEGGPAGLSPAGFSFPLLPDPEPIGGLQLVDSFGASAGAFTRLGLVMWLSGGRLRWSFNSARSHVKPSTAERFGRDLREALLALLGEAPAPALPQGGLVQRLVRAAEQAGDRVVWEEGERTLSGHSLLSCSASLARTLRGERIALLSRPGLEALVASLAVWRAGLCLVPLEPSWPDARLRQILEQAQPQLLLSPAALVQRAMGLGDVPVRGIVLNELQGQHTEGPLLEAPLAQLTFTSGSTGAPKGVAVSGEAILSFLEWTTRQLQLGGEDRLLMSSSLAFDASLRQSWAPLLSGARGVVAPEGLLRDPQAARAWMEDRQISAFNGVPSAWSRLLDAGPLPHALRWVLLGGEALPASLANRTWAALHAESRRGRLANLYGPTEALVNSTWHELSGPLPSGAHTAPIGRVRAGLRLALLPVAGQPPDVGEIAVGGAIALGYWRDPEREAQRFAELPGLGRAFLTGDLARRLPDGTLEFIGRKDRQVQVWGNRVELDEIEHTLAQHPGVASARVSWDGARLRAAVEPRPGADLDAPRLRSWLNERLPSWMCPHELSLSARLDEGPSGKLTASGKLAPLATTPLAQAWRSVLHLTRDPSPEDDFFSLGGDSMLLLELMDGLRAQGQALPSPTALYEARRLSAMQALLDRSAHTLAPAPLPDPEALPLLTAQRGFVLAHRAHPLHPPVFRVLARVSGDLQVLPMLLALQRLTEHHPLLNCALSPEDQRWRRDPSAPSPLQWEDLSALPNPEATLERRWREEASLRFPLERAPLWRVRLLRLGPSEHALLLSAHHALLDAWSAWRLCRDWLSLLAQPNNPLPPSPSWSTQLAREQRPASPEALAWWRAQLQDLPQGPAPEQPLNQEGELRLSPESWSALRRRAAQAGVSPFVWVLSAFARTLALCAGLPELVLAVALSHRDPENAGLIAPLARGLPLRLPAQADPTQTQALFTAAMRFADTPALDLAAAAGPEALRILGRFFFTWLEPGALPQGEGGVQVDWAGARYRFAAQATDTEVFLGAQVGEGLVLHWLGGPLAAAVGWVLGTDLANALDSEPDGEARAEGPDLLPRPNARTAPSLHPVPWRPQAQAGSALIAYAPAGTSLPWTEARCVERLDTDLGLTELWLLPLCDDELDRGDLEQQLSAALNQIQAPVIALAGLLPVRTGLAARALPGLGDRVLTTGHGATVAAMYLSVQQALAATGRSWAQSRVGMLGYGAIGQAVLALLRARWGEPRSLRIQDPLWPDSRSVLEEVDLILGASSGGASLAVEALAPGVIVVDDSFPRCFDEAQALARMEQRGDVLLVGGGALALGELRVSSPFPGGDTVRAVQGGPWLPGCHAEALMLAHSPALGPTVGVVEVQRAEKVLESIEALGIEAAPLHLGAWRVPEGLVRRLGG